MGGCENVGCWEECTTHATVDTIRIPLPNGDAYPAGPVVWGLRTWSPHCRRSYSPSMPTAWLTRTSGMRQVLGALVFRQGVQISNYSLQQATRGIALATGPTTTFRLRSVTANEKTWRAPGACPTRYLCIKYLISSPKYILTLGSPPSRLH